MENSNTKLKIVSVAIMVLAVIALFILFFGWQAERDRRIMTAGTIYLNCIWSEYDQSPEDYRAEHGELPVCKSLLNNQ